MCKSVLVSGTVYTTGDEADASKEDIGSRSILFLETSRQKMELRACFIARGLSPALSSYWGLFGGTCKIDTFSLILYESMYRNSNRDSLSYNTLPRRRGWSSHLQGLHTYPQSTCAGTIPWMLWLLMVSLGAVCGADFDTKTPKWNGPTHLIEVTPCLPSLRPSRQFVSVNRAGWCENAGNFLCFYWVEILLWLFHDCKYFLFNCKLLTISLNPLNFLLLM